MLRPKDAEKFVREYRAEQKAREASGERRATHADIERLMIPYEARMADPLGEDLSPAEIVYYRELAERLEWDEKDLPFLADLENDEFESESESETESE